MSQHPYWFDSVKRKPLPRISKSLSADALVVGGGLMGVTAAYLLARAGQKVVLLERDEIGAGDTGNTTAHLTSVMDTRLTDLSETFGDGGARALWDAGEAAIHQIREIAAECKIDCDLSSVPGYLHLPGISEEDLESDGKVASRLGIDAEYVQSVPFVGKPGLRFPNQARFHPIKYIRALVSQVERMGGQVYEGANADEFLNDGRTVRTGSFSIEASKTIIATHTPVVGHAGVLGAALLQTKLYLYTTYAICFQIAKGSIPDGLFWNTLDPYNYLRLQPGSGVDYVIYGGEDHKTGQVADTNAPFRELEAKLRGLFAEHGIRGEFAARWSGQVVETNDGAPFIGESATNQFAGTGFSGNGMTFGTLAAIMAMDWFFAQKNPWADLLSPSRGMIRGGALDYLKENADYPYYLIQGLLRSPAGESLSAVPPGEGRILSLNGERVAVSRDANGEFTKLSPTCTHLGCQVNWNVAEGTWDCPCHGSRFRPSGEVLSGPAEAPLPRK